MPKSSMGAGWFHLKFHPKIDKISISKSSTNTEGIMFHLKSHPRCDKNSIFGLLMASLMPSQISQDVNLARWGWSLHKSHEISIFRGSTEWGDLVPSYVSS